MAKLESISKEPSSDYPKAFLNIMDIIEGPYAFLYFHVSIAIGWRTLKKRVESARIYYLTFAFSIKIGIYKTDILWQGLSWKAVTPLAQVDRKHGSSLHFDFSWIQFIPIRPIATRRSTSRRHLQHVPRFKGKDIDALSMGIST